MYALRLGTALVFAVLLGGATVPPRCALAQRADGPGPTARITPSQFRVSPILLTIDALLGSPRFAAADGTLTLTETVPQAGNVILLVNGRRPEGMLWSGSLARPCRFTLATTENTVSLQDDQGRVLWSRHFETPSLTLTFGRDDAATLTDRQGNVLWSGRLRRSLMGYVRSTERPRPPGFGRSSTEGYSYLYNRSTGEVILQDEDGNMLWSGRPVDNVGLRVRSAQSPDRSYVLGIPSLFLLPPDKTFHLTVTAEPITATFYDAAHRPLGTKTAQAVRMDVVSDDPTLNGRFDLMRLGFWSEEARLPTVTPLVRSTVYLAYRDAQGKWLKAEKITRQKALPEARSRGMDRISWADLDENGRKIRYTDAYFSTLEPAADR